MPTAPDSLRKKIQQLQTKLTAIEAQQSAARTAALTFLRQAIADLGLSAEDVAAALAGAGRGTTRRGRPAKGMKGAKGSTGARKGPKAKQGRRKKTAAKTAAKSAAKTAAKGRAKGAAGVKVPAKYRGPAGETWSGRGKQPRWLAALVAEGRTPTEFLIAP